MRAAVCCLAIGLLLGALPGRATWRVQVAQRDVTALAMPLPQGAGLPAVNVMALAPLLNLEARASRGELRLVDAQGAEWRATSDDLALRGPGDRAIPLESPVLLQGATAYLPIDTVAQLAGLRVSADVTARRVTLAPERTLEPAADLSEAEEWQAFTIEKNEDERKRGLQGVTAGGNGAQPPSAHPLYRPPTDTVRWRAGVGYVQGADWGTDLSAAGTVEGMKMHFNARVTQGARGARLEGMRLALWDEEHASGFEAGDLLSDVWGSVIGMRYTRQLGSHRPSVALYRRECTREGDEDEIHVGLADEFSLGSAVKVGGEIASGGSRFLKAKVEMGKLTLNGYHRAMTGDEPRGKGAFFSYAFARGLTLYGGVSRTDTEGDATDWYSVSLAAPLPRAANLILEHTRSTSTDADDTTHAVMLLFPAGPVRVLTRYQWGDTARFLGGPQIAVIGEERRSLTATATYFASPRLSFDYQASMRWQASGRDSGNRQLISTYRFSPATRLQVISDFPHFTEPNRLRLRLHHTLNPDYALTVDYGRLRAFQGEGVTPGERGFTVMLTRQWTTSTPARGGQVSGQVTDTLGHPVSGVAVLLNGQRLLTGADGRYCFTNVRPGAYHLALDDRSLPANLLGGNGARDLIITNASREVVDFYAIPLNAITGRVYGDRDGDGRYDPGEGVGHVVVRMNGFATVTNADGFFGFYNLAPGAHTVRLDASRLPSTLAPDSPAEIIVDLEPDTTHSRLEFRLRYVDKAVVFQRVEEEEE